MAIVNSVKRLNACLCRYIECLLAGLFESGLSMATVIIGESATVADGRHAATDNRRGVRV